MIFEQPAGGVEGVANRDMDILMRVVRYRIAPDDNLFPRNLEVDPDAEQIALMTARVPAFDDDAAGDDPIKEALELGGTLLYSCCDRLGRVHVAKRDLQWQLHRISPFHILTRGHRNAALSSSRPRVLRISAGSSQPRRACSTAKRMKASSPVL